MKMRKVIPCRSTWEICSIVLKTMTLLVFALWVHVRLLFKRSKHTYLNHHTHTAHTVHTAHIAHMTHTHTPHTRHTPHTLEFDYLQKIQFYAHGSWHFRQNQNTNLSLKKRPTHETQPFLQRMHTLVCFSFGVRHQEVGFGF